MSEQSEANTIPQEVLTDIIRFRMTAGRSSFIPPFSEAVSFANRINSCSIEHLSTLYANCSSDLAKCLAGLGGTLFKIYTRYGTQLTKEIEKDWVSKPLIEEAGHVFVPVSTESDEDIYLDLKTNLLLLKAFLRIIKAITVAYREGSLEEVPRYHTKLLLFSLGSETSTKVYNSDNSISPDEDFLFRSEMINLQEIIYEGIHAPRFLTAVVRSGLSVCNPSFIVGLNKDLVNTQRGTIFPPSFKGMTPVPMSFLTSDIVDRPYSSTINLSSLVDNTVGHFNNNVNSISTRIKRMLGKNEVFSKVHKTIPVSLITKRVPDDGVNLPEDWGNTSIIVDTSIVVPERKRVNGSSVKAYIHRLNYRYMNRVNRSLKKKGSPLRFVSIVKSYVNLSSSGVRRNISESIVDTLGLSSPGDSTLSPSQLKLACSIAGRSRGVNFPEFMFNSKGEVLEEYHGQSVVRLEVYPVVIKELVQSSEEIASFKTEIKDYLITVMDDTLKYKPSKVLVPMPIQGTPRFLAPNDYFGATVSGDSAEHIQSLNDAVLNCYVERAWHTAKEGEDYYNDWNQAQTVAFSYTSVVREPVDPLTGTYSVARVRNLTSSDILQTLYSRIGLSRSQSPHMQPLNWVNMYAANHAFADAYKDIVDNISMLLRRQFRV